jgi:hypothetical protein
VARRCDELSLVGTGQQGRNRGHCAAWILPGLRHDLADQSVLLLIRPGREIRVSASELRNVPNTSAHGLSIAIGLPVASRSGPQGIILTATVERIDPARELTPLVEIADQNAAAELA